MGLSQIEALVGDGSTAKYSGDGRWKPSMA